MDICCKGDSAGPYAPLALELGAGVFHHRLSPTQIGFVRSLQQLVARGAYDIVHNHLQAYSGLPVFVCRRLGVPVITSFHCTAFPPETWLRRPGISQLRNAYATLSVKYALRRSVMLTGCSHAVVDSVRHTYGGNGRPWRVIYYGTDLAPVASKAQRQEFRASFGWPEETPIIVHVGRFAEQKNHAGLISIFELLLRRTPNARLLLIGGGSTRPAIEAMVQKRGLSRFVVFLGFRDDVPAILALCNVFLFPSWFEGLGVAALEASAARLPVVASNVPALSEAVEENVTGLLRNPNDLDGMADAVHRILSDTDFAHALGAAGRKRIAERFSKKGSADSLLRTYDECLS